MEDLLSLKQYAHEHSVPIMQDGGIEFICEYIKSHDVRRVLEIGTAIGYSAMRFAGLRDDLFVDTVEVDIDRYHQAVRNIADAGLMERITVYLGDALTFDFESEYDLIFIDAAKSQYINYFEKFKANLTPQGVIITDNLFFHGMVEDLSLTHNYSTKKLIRKLRKYIDFLKFNQEYHTDFYSIGDGVSVSRKRKSCGFRTVSPLGMGDRVCVCIPETQETLEVNGELTEGEMSLAAQENPGVHTVFVCKAGAGTSDVFAGNSADNSAAGNTGSLWCVRALDEVSALDAFVAAWCIFVYAGHGKIETLQLDLGNRVLSFCYKNGIVQMKLTEAEFKKLNLYLDSVSDVAGEECKKEKNYSVNIEGKRIFVSGRCILGASGMVYVE